MSVYLDDVLMAGKLEKLNNTKENIKEKFKISKFIKFRKFLGVCYEWGRDEKYTYAKTTMEKDAKNLIEAYNKYTGSDLKVQKPPGAPDMTLSESNREEPDNINKYRSFVGQ